MTRNNLKVAITGGIGSGKTAVSKIIEEQGFNVISCDKINEELTSDKEFLKILSNEFGDILEKSGGLDRKKLSEIVFSDSSKLKKLNELTHPEIINRALNAMSGGGIRFCEVPLLFENGFETLFDEVIVVLRDENLRIASVAQRDGLRAEDVKKRIKNQFNYDNSTFKKYYVIRNNLDLENLRIQTRETVKKILKNNY